MDTNLESIHGQTPVFQGNMLMWMNLWKNMTDTGFSLYLGLLKETTIANVLYTYEKSDVTTILLDKNNTIYMGYVMEYYIANPLQSKENGIQIYICPNRYYIDDSIYQTVTILDGIIIPILYDIF